MKRVLILTNSINGLYSFRRELMQRLVQEKFETIIVAPSDYRTAYFSEIGCQCINTSFNSRGKNPLKDIKLQMKYIKLIKKIQPSVVLTYTIKPNVYGGLACRLLNIPYIANITGLGTAVENKGILQKVTLLLYKLSLKKAKRVFFQNKENQLILNNKNIAVDNSKLIPGSGVNLQYFSYEKYPSISPTKFLFIGRIMKEKGIDQYLKAAEYCKEKHPNTEFHILGACGDDYIETINEMQKRGIIHFHGKQDDVREFHKISHCTIHPSFYPEGMSNVLLESAACGRPVITTNRSGCREIVDVKVNGYIVKQKDYKDLIEKIELFLNLPDEEKKSMGLAGRKKVKKEFNRQIVVDAYIEEIKQIAFKKIC